MTDSLHLWDAGTEPNAEPPGEGLDQAPMGQEKDVGDDEGGVVQRVDDGYDYPDVSNAIQVTLTPHDSMDGGEPMTDEPMGDGSMN